MTLIQSAITDKALVIQELPSTAKQKKDRPVDRKVTQWFQKNNLWPELQQMYDFKTIEDITTYYNDCIKSIFNKLFNHSVWKNILKEVDFCTPDYISY
ncbi:unnamed protein product [Didymodactylos carnosus]|uniref:Uncharacterized protein n=1 Tax=Didymodactylos carnosus TaxID=1234261 RepID=A0A8S2G0I7_9BILA|nr:unnamed protein product [Didymodactylos carnosus]CAF4398336.1 unnamed protein product [Didymodactylos carnosus]